NLIKEVGQSLLAFLKCRMYPLVHGLLSFLKDLRVGSLELREEAIVVATTTRWSCHRDLPCGRTGPVIETAEAITFNLELPGNLAPLKIEGAWHRSLFSSLGEPR